MPQILFNLLEDGNAEIAACSRGLLVKGGFFDYIETVDLPEYSKSSGPIYESTENPEKQPQKDYLRLFPNPAGDYVIVYYNFGSAYQVGLITINDMKGTLARSYTIDPGKNQIVLDLKNFPNGLYIVGLYADDRLLEAEKLSKGRD